MKKDLQIIGCFILVVFVVVMCFMIFGKTSDKGVEEVNEETSDLLLENLEDVNIEPSVNFEQDVMADLEKFFAGGNGYEDIEGEFGFIGIGEE